MGFQQGKELELRGILLLAQHVALSVADMPDVAQLPPDHNCRGNQRAVLLCLQALKGGVVGVIQLINEYVYRPGRQYRPEVIQHDLAHRPRKNHG